jgi:hypothetical protein
MRELDNLLRLGILLITLLVVYVIASLVLAILHALNTLNQVLSQFPSTISFTPFNPESFIIGLVIVAIITLIMKAVID